MAANPCTRTGDKMGGTGCSFKLETQRKRSLPANWFREALIFPRRPPTKISTKLQGRCPWYRSERVRLGIPGGVDLRASVQRHLHPDLAQESMINLGCRDLRSLCLFTNICENSAPWIDNHAVPIAHSLIVVFADLRREKPSANMLLLGGGTGGGGTTWHRVKAANLCSSDNIRLRLNGSRPKQHLPVSPTSRDSEGGRERYYVAPLPFEHQTYLRESQLSCLPSQTRPRPEGFDVL